MLIEGVWAEIKVGGEHLRLFAEHNAQGVQASVYNVNAKSWIAPSEAVDDIEQGKEKAAEYAKAYPLRKPRCCSRKLTWTSLVLLLTQGNPSDEEGGSQYDHRHPIHSRQVT
jgi:hypothetical protein